jgi:tetratricopeptide (TPR) repeat protein
LLIPLLGLVALETGLRLAGYGYPTSFFLHVSDRGRAMLRDNPRFGWRFFPPAVARAPRPLFIETHKPPNNVRVFVFGESAAMGDPEPSYGFARQLERLLQARHPDQEIEVVNAAMTAINSHVIRQIARDCQPGGGDFWLVYAGNNEVIGPFGAGTAFGRQAAQLPEVRSVLALESMRTGQLLAQLAPSSAEPVAWQGLEFFLKWKVAWVDPRLPRTYASFAANLDDIVESGRRSGAAVIAATVPVNLRDFPPLASVHRPGLVAEPLAEWEQSYAAGLRAEAQGRSDAALASFRRAAEIDDGFALLAFHRAGCELALQQPAADADFRRARDLDALRFRADSRINEIIRQTAAARGIAVADFDRELGGDAGDALFYDHVHLNFTGNYRVAVGFAAEMEKHWPGVRTNTQPWLTEAEVARRLAWTSFDESRVAGEVRARLQQPPFSAQENFRARDERWGAAITAWSAPEADGVSNYLAAVALAPDDWLLHANFARLLEAAGDGMGAAAQWGEVARWLPCSQEGWSNLGRLARLAGQPDRAGDFLREALKQNPYSVETLTESGVLEESLGHTNTAEHRFRAALRLQPGFSAARVDLGLLLARQGDAAGAAAEYRRALGWQTNNVEARINLANLLAGRGETDQATVLFEQAVALDPDNPIARYDFGRLLAAQGRSAAAVSNLEVALRRQPGVAEIHFELGEALGRSGRDNDALAEFAQAVRLKPDYPDARLNYGVALARCGRYGEAVAEFRETLRLRPQDERAQRMLDQASHSLSGGSRNQ